MLGVFLKNLEEASKANPAVVADILRATNVKLKATVDSAKVRLAKVAKEKAAA